MNGQKNQMQQQFLLILKKENSDSESEYTVYSSEIYSEDSDHTKAKKLNIKYLESTLETTSSNTNKRKLDANEQEDY